jgi:squalene-associated FAD-dependent desaturase
MGGGLSGLSAAVELAARDRRVMLLEQHGHLGGRVYSFVDSTTGDTVDNGQHLMMGCYHAARHYLKLIGAEHLAELQSALRIAFLQPAGKPEKFVCPALPAPFHLLGGLLGFGSVPFADRLRMLKVAVSLLSSSQDKERELDRITASEWLALLGQTKRSRGRLWDVIAIGALNNYPENVSALMLFRVLRAAFLGRRENSSLLIPGTGLSELLVDPAAQFIEKHGGTVLTGAQCVGFDTNRNRVIAVRTLTGKKFAADTFISAVPWHAAEKLMPSRAAKNLNRFHSSPIIGIHLWFDAKVTDIDFAALLDMTVQWVFNKEKKSKVGEFMSSGEKRQMLTLVISGAHSLMNKGKGELVKIALHDLHRVLPQTKSAKLVRSLVIKEKRATFTPAPGLEEFRPSPRTEYANLILAGDWTGTGYPATIEGAVLSGQKAAEMVLLGS